MRLWELLRSLEKSKSGDPFSGPSGKETMEIGKGPVLLSLKQGGFRCQGPSRADPSRRRQSFCWDFSLKLDPEK